MNNMSRFIKMYEECDVISIDSDGYKDKNSFRFTPHTPNDIVLKDDTEMHFFTKKDINGAGFENGSFFIEDEGNIKEVSFFTAKRIRR